MQSIHYEKLWYANCMSNFATWVLIFLRSHYLHKDGGHINMIWSSYFRVSVLPITDSIWNLVVHLFWRLRDCCKKVDWPKIRLMIKNPHFVTQSSRYSGKSTQTSFIFTKFHNNWIEIVGIWPVHFFATVSTDPKNFYYISTLKKYQFAVYTYNEYIFN